MDTNEMMAQSSQVKFKKMDIEKEFNEEPFSFFRGAGAILLAGDRTSYNAMTIGWGALGTLWSKPAVTVYVAPARYTHEFMEKTKYFVAMTFKDKHIMDYMGSHSGRDVNKEKELGLHVAYTEHGMPYFLEAEMVIECELMYKDQFKEENFMNDVPKDRYKVITSGLHSMYIGEVISAIKKDNN